MSGGPEELVCPKCGAANPAGAFDCRVCQALLLGGKHTQLTPLRREGDPPLFPPPKVAPVEEPWIVDVEPPDRSHVEPQPFQFTMATMMWIITIVSVTFGLLVTLPGLGVFVVILILPALVRNALVVRRRAQLGWRNPTRQRLELFFSSLSVAIAAMIVLAIVLNAAIFVICFVDLLPRQLRQDPAEFVLTLFFFLIGGGFVILSVVVLFHWARSRWRRDTELPLRERRARDP